MKTTEQIVRAIASPHLPVLHSDTQLITLTVEQLITLLVETFERATDADPTWSHGKRTA